MLPVVVFRGSHHLGEGMEAFTRMLFLRDAANWGETGQMRTATGSLYGRTRQSALAVEAYSLFGKGKRRDFEYSITS